MRDVPHIGHRMVVAPVRVVIRAAAAPIVEADDPPFAGMALGEIGEVRAVAYQSGKAEQGQARRQGIAVVAKVEREAVLRGEPPLAKRGHGKSGYCRQRLRSLTSEKARPWS